MIHNRRWRVNTGDIVEFVYAKDQFEAWDTLRDRPVEDFGLIVGAEPGENDNPFWIRTTMLMARWGRHEDAERFADLAAKVGMPDTRAEDGMRPKTQRQFSRTLFRPSNKKEQDDPLSP